MKKALSILLAVLLLAFVTVCAWAEDETIEVPLPEVGLTLRIPIAILQGQGTAGGIVEAAFAEEVGYQSGVYLTQFIYEPNPDIFEPENYAPYLTFICMRDDCDENVANDPELAAMIPGDSIYELTTVGPYTHYAAVGTDHFPAGFSQANIDEYQSFLAYAEEIIYNATYDQPKNPYAGAIGTAISFETKDLDGNAVNSADLFAANEITMLNIWETGCGPCKGELPELAQIHERLQTMGCGIVGLLYDSDSQENIDTAKELMRDAGISYPTVQCPENFDDLFDLSGFPTSYFINRNGEIIGAPVVGAMVDRYEGAIQDLLSGDQESGTDTQVQKGFSAQAGIMKVAEKPAPATSDGGYRIICLDESGNPVAGATIQFCSDTMCQMGKTDENGVAEFDNAPGHYVVHLLKPPAGFAKDSTEYEAPDVGGDLTIVLKAG